jgi:hypothetical protein
MSPDVSQGSEAQVQAVSNKGVTLKAALRHVRCTSLSLVDRLAPLADAGSYSAQTCAPEQTGEVETPSRLWDLCFPKGEDDSERERLKDLEALEEKMRALADPVAPSVNPQTANAEDQQLTQLRQLFQQIGQEEAQKAAEENRRLGIPATPPGFILAPELFELRRDEVRECIRVRKLLGIVKGVATKDRLLVPVVRFLIEHRERRLTRNYVARELVLQR